MFVSKVKGTTRVVFKTRNLTLQENCYKSKRPAEEYKIKAEDITSENISSTISNEMKSKAKTSAIVAGLAMLVYIWFRFKELILRYKFYSSFTTRLFDHFSVLCNKPYISWKLLYRRSSNNYRLFNKCYNSCI